MCSRLNVVLNNIKYVKAHMIFYNAANGIGKCDNEIRARLKERGRDTNTCLISYKLGF